MSGIDIDTLEGWLEKEKSRGKFSFLGDTTKRWFKVQAAEGVEDELVLCYFKSNKDSQPRGWIYLSDVLEVHDTPSKLTLITPSRELRLRASTRAEQRLWGRGLRELCPNARSFSSSDSSNDLKPPAELKEPVDVQRYSPRSESPVHQPAKAAAKETVPAPSKPEKVEVSPRAAAGTGNRSATPTNMSNGSASVTRGEPRHGTSTSTRLHQHIVERHGAEGRPASGSNGPKPTAPPSPYRASLPETDELEDITVPDAARLTTPITPQGSSNRLLFDAKAERQEHAKPTVAQSEATSASIDAEHTVPRVASSKQVADFPLPTRIAGFEDDSSSDDEFDLAAEKARVLARAQAKARAEEQEAAQRRAQAAAKPTPPSGRPPLPSKPRDGVATPSPKSTVSGGGGGAAKRTVGTPPPFKRSYDPGVTPDDGFVTDDWDHDVEAPPKPVTSRPIPSQHKTHQQTGYAGGVKPDEDWLDADFDE